MRRHTSPGRRRGRTPYGSPRARPSASAFVRVRPAPSSDATHTSCVTAPVMLSVGLPLDGIALLVAADAIPDIFNTVINVTGDMAVAAMIEPGASVATA